MFVEHEKREVSLPYSREPQVTPLADWQKVLLKAADMIEQEGLSCGGATDRYGRPCVIHAINLSAEIRDVGCEAQERVRRRVGCLPLWSDAAGRAGRAAQVAATLRSVALGG